MNQPLGKLTQIKDLRSVWKGEASHFTPWLAQEENLAMLAETLNLDLELEAQEKEVGPFRADILCRETANNTWVLVENQLERTDHVHLGQLLTYASGLKAVTIVWIAERFTDEHQATLEWLNETTGEEINFFGLEIELWKIGDSPMAPKFNVRAKPNEWTKGKTGGSGSVNVESLTPAKALQLEFWTELRNYIEIHGTVVRCQKPLPQHWLNFAIGTSRAYIYAFADTRSKRIGVRLQIGGGSDRIAFFNLLLEEREAIEAEIGEVLDWEEFPSKSRKSSFVSIRHEGLDPNKKHTWPEQHAWLLKQIEAFKTTFGPRVKALDPGDYISETSEGLDD